MLPGFLLLLLSLLPQVEVLPPTGKWVTDRADLLTPQEERLLTQKLRAIADTTSVQIVVVTLPSLEGADIAEYAIELGQRWGVGQEPYDNGIVILVAREERRVFIATGQGLEAELPDVVVGRIIREVIVPAFRAGRYYEGLSRAIDLMVARIAGVFPPAESRRAPHVDTATLAFFLILLIILGFFISEWLASRRRRTRFIGYPEAASSAAWETLPPVIIYGGPGHGWHGHGEEMEDRWDDVFVGGGGDFGGGGAGGSW